MARKTGPPPIPTERKRRTGNPSRRPLPDLADVVALEAVPAGTIPEPPRPLDVEGRKVWDRVWGAGRHWLSPATDLEAVLMACEQVDERIALRARVLEVGDVDDRKALRALERALADAWGVLGLTPADRTRLGLAEVQAAATIDTIRRGAGGGAGA